MDDNTKNVNQNPLPVAPAEPSAPVGSTSKETEPVSAPVSEYVKLSERQPEIDQELADLGVKEVSDKPNLTSEHKELGVDHAGLHVPVATSPSGKITMPMSEEEVAEKLKTGQDDDSGKWLAGLIQKIIKVLGF